MSALDRMNQPPDILMSPQVMATLRVSDTPAAQLLADEVLRGINDQARVYVFNGERLDEVAAVVEVALVEAQKGETVPGSDDYRADVLTVFGYVLRGMKEGLELVKANHAQRSSEQ